MKYVMLDIEGLQAPIMFPDYIEHQAMVDAVRMATTMDVAPKPLGAGFVHTVNGDLRCYGYSESLKTESRAEDELIIKLALEATT